MNNRIIIVGDSWAAPPEPSQEIANSYTRQGHFSSRLQELGWRIENYGVRGGSNLDSWRRLVREATENKPDWIIWFHTELGRDWFREQVPRQPWYYEQKIEQVSRKVYKEIAGYLSDIDPVQGMIVVEGQSPVQDPWFTEYLTATEIVKDWRSYLCRKSLPRSQIAGCMISNTDFLSLCMDPLKQQLLWAENTKRILDEMQKHVDLFPDFAHPGDIAQADLVLTLHKSMSRCRLSNCGACELAALD
jgi:hypothetical protein